MELVEITSIRRIRKYTIRNLKFAIQ